MKTALLLFMLLFSELGFSKDIKILSGIDEGDPVEVLLKKSGDYCIILFPEDERKVVKTDCKIIINSKNKKTFCTKEMTLCKTKKEIIKYIRDEIYTIKTMLHNESNSYLEDDTKEDISLQATDTMKPIKGFSLDMKIDDACSRLKSMNEIWHGLTNGFKKIKTSKGIVCGYVLEQLNNGKSGSFIITNPEGRIEYISLITGTVNKLFKSKNLTTEEFADAFFQSYGMTEVKWKQSITKTGHSIYTYTYKDFQKGREVVFIGADDASRKLIFSRLNEVPSFD